MSAVIFPASIEVPGSMVYSDVPPAIRDTYYQLRGLAAPEYKETPPFAYSELAVLFHKSHQSVYEHCIYLSRNHWMTIRDAGMKTYIFSFANPSSHENSTNDDDENDDGRSSLSSLNPLTPNQINKPKENTKSHGHENSGDDDKSLRVVDPNLRSPAVQLYRGITHITANQVQRENIAAQVADLTLWEETIKHWMNHGWSKMNVGGMLDSYAKGGVKACTLCNRKNGNGHQPHQVPEDRNEYIGGAYADFIKHG